MTMLNARASRNRSSASTTSIFLRWLSCLLIVSGTQPSWAITVSTNGVVTQLPTGLSTIDTLSGVVVDFSGNLYIIDATSNEIIKIGPDHVTTSVLSITGSTALSSPRGLAIDSSGNLYVADTGNNRIVKVSPSAAATVISTASITLNAPQGVAVDVAGNIFISDTGNSRIIKIPSAGTASVFTITSLSPVLSNQRGIAVDPTGNLYIADTGNSRVVKVSSTGTAGTPLTTVASVAVDGPSGVAIGNDGVLYIADTNATISGNPTPGRVVIVDSQGNSSELFSGAPVFNSPRAVAISPTGNLYVIDNGGTANAGRVQSFQTFTIDTANNFTSSLGFKNVQLGSAGTSLTVPVSIGTATTVSAISVYTSGTQNLDFTIANESTCATGTTSADCTIDVNFSPTAAGLRKGSLVVSYTSTMGPASGNLTIPLYGVADAPVAALSPSLGGVVNHTGTTTLNTPFQSTVDGAGNIYVANYSANTVIKIAGGSGPGTIVNTGSFTLVEPTGIALDASGDLFIADYGHSRIIEVDATGTASLFAISGLSQPINQPTALNFDAAGNLYITDYGNGRMIEVTPYGQGTVLATESITFAPYSITGSTVDSLGNVYIADRSSGRIVKVDPLGTATVLSFSAVGALSSPQGVAVDASNNLYVMDSSHRRIILVATTGATSVLPFSGVVIGNFIFGLTVDSHGNLLVADWSNNRLVKVNVGQSAFTFASTNTGATSSDSPQTATVTNLGDQPLVLSAAPTYTASFTENSSDTNLCTSTTTLSSGANCDVSIEFMPQTAGSLSASVTVNDNALNVANSTQAIAVSGTAINSADTTSITITAPSSVYGQPVSVVATVGDTKAGHTSTIPTGTVTFVDMFDSAVTPLNNGSPVSLTTGTATLNSFVFSGIGTHTITATYSGVGNTYLTSNATATITVGQSSVTVSGPAQPISIVNGKAASIPVTVTGAYTGLRAPSGTVTYSIISASGSALSSGPLTLIQGATASTASVPVPGTLGAGTYKITLTYSGDANYQGLSAGSLTLQIGQLTATSALVASPNPSVVTSPVTFTASVSSSAGTPTGTVNFLEGTTVLGASSLSSAGQASFTTAVLATGSHSITAAYSGDTNFTAGTSNTAVQLVEDFTLSTPSSATTSAPTATVAPGGAASFTLSVGPSAGTAFPAPIILSLSGLPPGATGTLTPVTLPAGASLSSVTIKIQLPQQTARLASPLRWVTPAMALLLLPFSGRMRRRRARGLERLGLMLLLIAASAGATAGLSGCGAKNTGYFGQPAQSYTVLITATSGSLSHSTSITLNVE